MQILGFVYAEIQIGCYNSGKYFLSNYCKMMLETDEVNHDGFIARRTCD